MRPIPGTTARRDPSRDAGRDDGEGIAGQIRKAIADGEANPGERLPAARDLAAELGVNRNTVLRALRDLRDEGLVDFRRGRGVVVTGSADRSVVLERARELVALGRPHGYRADDLVDIVAKAARS